MTENPAIAFSVKNNPGLFFMPFLMDPFWINTIQEPLKAYL